MGHSPRFASRSVNAEADALAALFDGGILRIYSGSQPSGADADITPTKKLLAELRWATPAFGRADDGLIVATDIPPLPALETGLAEWFRALDASGAPIVDGTVGTANADMVIESVAIEASVEVVVRDFRVQIAKR